MKIIFKLFLDIVIIVLVVMIVSAPIIESHTVESPTYFILKIDDISYSIPIIHGQIYYMQTIDGTKIEIEIPEPGSEWEECTEGVECK